MIATYNEWPDVSTLHEHIHSFTPFLVRNAGEYFSFASLQNKDTSFLVDVSCLPQESVELSGDPLKRELVSVPFSTFLQLFNAPLPSSSNSNSKGTSSLKLYLAQTLLYSSDPNQNLDAIPSAMDALTLPSVLEPYEVYEINLWANIADQAVSTTHYDGNHNLVLLSQGGKAFTLVSPEHTALLQPHSAYGTSPNHCSVSAAQIDGLSAAHPELNLCIHCQVRPGDALFIPEGWWHSVASDARSVATNVWFRSPVRRQIASVALAPYLLRSSVHCISEGVLASLRLNVYRAALDVNATVDEWDEEAFHSRVFGPTLLSSQLCLHSLANQARLWIPASTHHRIAASQWTSWLLSLSPEEAFRLTVMWEQPHVSAETYFETLFAYLGDRASEVCFPSLHTCVYAQTLLQQLFTLVRGVGQVAHHGEE